MLKSILKLIHPQFCINCGSPPSPICKNCLAKSHQEEIDFPLCINCENLCTNGKPHLICASNTPINKFLASYRYSGIVKKALQKKNKNPALLKDLLSQTKTIDLIKSFGNIDLIVPVPPSPRYTDPRIIQPTDLISNEISKILDLPICKALRKSPLSKQQKRQSLTQRTSPKVTINPKQALTARARRILLVDDVCTTGATLNTSAKTLIKAGAIEVAAYALCRDLRYN